MNCVLAFLQNEFKIIAVIFYIKLCIICINKAPSKVQIIMYQGQGL